MKSSLKWSADFETTTDENDCRVWAYALSNIDNPDDFRYGNSIWDFLEFCANPKENYEMYFFNLKFDGSFLISAIMKAGFEYIQDKKDRKDGTFTTLITDTGTFYAIEIYFEVKKRYTNKVKIIDAMKIFPNFSVEKLAVAFGLNISKLELDYSAKREIGHELSKEEIDYIRNDVEIVARALKEMFDRGLTKMTLASNAMSDFKKRCKHFKNYFPELPIKVDEDIRRSYKGGFTYLNEIYKEKVMPAGITLDVNSLYPSTMKLMPMPISAPVYYEGKYQSDSTYDLYVQSFSCIFELKKGKIPSIQLKHSFDFQSNEYIKSSNGEEIALNLTKPDFELFMDQYNVTNITYFGGWKFKSSLHVFDPYIDYWMNEKITAGKEGNKGKRQIAKLMLNSLY